MTLAVVVVTHNNAAQIGATLRAVEEQLEGGDELLVVDNGSADRTRELARGTSARARVLEQGVNRGFAAGCRAGASASTAPLLLFLNPDAALAPGCIAALRAVAAERPGWGAWQALVTMNGGRTINTAGNVVHYLGLSWAGRCGRPVAEAPDRPVEVPFASGAALAVRREAWEAAGGFDERYFMYVEDLDLCLRLRLAGHALGIAPAARVEHEYEFDKGPRKWFLLERNRWWTVLGDYPGGLLALVLPALLALECALLPVAARGGWLRPKLRAQAAVLRELPLIIERRRSVQARRLISSREFAAGLSAELDSPFLGPAAELAPLAALQRLYWAGVVRLLALVSRS